jgi:hypothetical protein
MERKTPRSLKSTDSESTAIDQRPTPTQIHRDRPKTHSHANPRQTDPNLPKSTEAKSYQNRPQIYRNRQKPKVTKIDPVFTKIDRNPQKPTEGPSTPDPPKIDPVFTKIDRNPQKPTEGPSTPDPPKIDPAQTHP